MTEWAVVPVLEAARVSAVHLEMRDIYLPGDEDYVDWQAGKPFTPERMRWWLDLVASTVARGVVMRRARVVSEPATEFIRYEYEITEHNIAAGEEVRWLPRHLASDLALPGNDFWLIDRELVIFNYFGGNGNWRETPEELSRELSTVDLCAKAFDAVWERAIPHVDYQP